MHIYVEKEFNRLHLERHRWNQLAKQNGTNTIFHTYEWNRCWWDVFKEDHELFVIVAKDDEELVGLAPLMVVRENKLSGQQKVIQFIGTGMSDYCDFLAKDNDTDILSNMVDFLFESSDQWDQMRFVGIPGHSKTGKVINERLEKHGLKTFFVHYSDCPVLIIRDNLQYARDVSNKKSLLRRRNHFRKLGAYEVLHLVDQVEIEKYLHSFFEQHISRWKDSGTPSLFLQRNNRRFYEELVKNICVNQWLIFTVIKSRGVEIAFHFGFDYNNTFIWYKPTFSPLVAQNSPGQVLLKELLDYAITTGKDEFDFTVGNEPFKKRFTNTTRRNQTFLIYKRSLRFEYESAYHLFRRIGSYAARGVKTLGHGKFDSPLENFRFFRKRGGKNQSPAVGTGFPQGKVNILYLIDTLKDGGGTETHLADVAAHLSREKFNCLISAFDSNRGPFVRKIEKNTPVVCIPVGRFYGFDGIFKAIRLRNLIRNNHIDIVQTFHFKSDTYGVLVSKLSGVHKIISSRRDLGDLKKPRHFMLNRLINPFIDHFIMVCNSVGEAVQRDEGVPGEKMTTIYNGVDLSRFPLYGNSESVPLKRKLGMHDGTFVIGSIAYFRPEKAYHIFFEAIEKLQSSMDDWAVLILGDGPLENYFKKQCKEMGIDRHVKFMGSVLDVPQYISLMDVVCLVPNQNEGFSNAILEAMTLKKPIIATHVGGNAEAIEDGETGIMIPPDNSQMLTDAILKLYKDVDLRKRMGERGRERIEKHFVLEDMLGKMERLYLQVYQENNH